MSVFFCVTNREHKLHFLLPFYLQRPHSQLNIDDIKIFTTPRKLIHSLQDRNDTNFDFAEKQIRRCRSPALNKSRWSPTRTFEGNGLCYELKCDVEDNKNLPETGAQAQVDSESISSTDSIPAVADKEVSHEVSPEDKTGVQNRRSSSFKKVALNLVCGLFFILLAIMSAIWAANQDKGSNLTPT